MNTRQIIRYWCGLFFGSISGTNSSKLAKSMILKDIKHCSYDLKVISCTADLKYWDQNIIEKLKEKKKNNSHIQIEFIVGPKLENPLIEDLANKGIISLLRLKKIPPCDCRMIDFRDTYTSIHGGEGIKRKYEWNFSNNAAIKAQIEFYKKIRKKAA